MDTSNENKKADVTIEDEENFDDTVFDDEEVRHTGKISDANDEKLKKYGEAYSIQFENCTFKKTAILTSKKKLNFVEPLANYKKHPTI